MKAKQPPKGGVDSWWPKNLTELPTGTVREVEYFPVDGNGDVWGPRSLEECHRLMEPPPEGSVYEPDDFAVAILSREKQISYGPFEPVYAKEIGQGKGLEL